MNFGILLEELGERLVELKGAEGMWGEAVRKRALNLEQINMCLELKLIRAVVVRDALINTQDYSITGALIAGGFAITNFLGVLGDGDLHGLIYDDGTTETRLSLTSVEQLYKTNPNWRREVSGTPAQFFPAEGGEVFKDLISVFPKPLATVTNGFRLHHLVRPADMVNDDHEPFNTTAGTTIQYPSLIPYHDALIFRAAARLLQDDSEEKVKLAMQFYALAIRKAKGHVFMPVRTEAEQVEAIPAYSRRR